MQPLQQARQIPGAQAGQPGPGRPAPRWIDGLRQRKTTGRRQEQKERGPKAAPQDKVARGVDGDPLARPFEAPLQGTRGRQCGGSGVGGWGCGLGWVGVGVGVGVGVRWGGGWGVGAAAGELALETLWLCQSLQARYCVFCALATRIIAAWPRSTERALRATLCRTMGPPRRAHTLGIQGIGSMPFCSQGRWHHNSTGSALQAILQACVCFLCAPRQESFIGYTLLPGNPHTNRPLAHTLASGRRSMQQRK